MTTTADMAAAPRQLTARTHDEARFAERPPPLTQYLQHAVNRSRRNPLGMVREYRRLARGRGKLTLREYIQYGVYDPSHNDDRRGRFVSESLHWPITRACCDMTWQATTEDKWLCACLLARAGLPAPDVLAVVDRTNRTFPGTRTIGTAAQLRDLAVAFGGDGSPIFCKPNRGIASFGAFVITEAEPNRLRVDGRGWMDYGACLDELIGQQTYLLQPVQRNHAFLERFTNRLATVRVYVLRTDGDAKLPFAVLKMAHPRNVADNFWRPGNLACDVDPENGAIRTARTKDPFGTTDHVDHPVSGHRLVGETIPGWRRVVDLVRNVSPLFAPVRYQSMDIAILADGPTVIEVNTGGAFNLPQLASGRGFLSDAVLEFLGRQLALGSVRRPLTA